MKDQRSEVSGQRSAKIHGPGSRIEESIESELLLPDSIVFSGKKHFFEFKVDGYVKVYINIDGEKSVRSMDPADVFCLRHEFKAAKDNPVFPLRIEYGGQTYFLQKTSSNKLMLTK